MGAVETLKFHAGELLVLVRATLGAFQRSLKSTVRRKEAKHFRSNTTLRDYRYPTLRRAMDSVGDHPIVATTVMTGIYLVVCAWTWLAPLPGPLEPGDVKDFYRDFQSLNMALLGVQASFIGLVFPLVIAFVGLLNQGRASFATRLTIYFEESGAPLVGTSSLLLCIVIAVQLPFSGLVPVRVVAAGAVLNLLWLALNVLAMGFFLFRTIAFVQPAQRDPIARSYVANVSWRHQLHTLLLANNWGNAGTYGHLPTGDDEGEFLEEGKRATIYYSPLFNTDPALATRKLSRDFTLADVRFGILKPVVASWLQTVRRSTDAKRVTLSFPLLPDEAYKGDVALARSSVPLGWGARAALPLGFRFKKKSRLPFNTADTATLLKEMIADLLALADLRQVEEFGAQLNVVADFHAFLYLIAQSTDEDFNFSQFESTWTKTVAQEWASEYRDLQRRAAERLPEEPELFGRCCYVPARIYGRCHDTVSPVALTPLLALSANLFHHLMVWAVGEHRNETGQTPDAGKSFMLTRPAAAHAGAWRTLVAGREEFLDVILRWPKSDAPDWKALQRHNVNVIDHLRFVAEMVGRGAWNGDRLAVLWAVDLLIGWIERAERDWPDQGHTWWALRPQSLTLDLFAADWPAVQALPITTTDVPVTPRDVYAGIFHNAWRDHIVTVAAVCIHWCFEFGSGGTAALAARMLLAGERYDKGASSVRAADPPSATDILIATLRIVGAGWPFSKSYSSRFESLAERLDELRQEPWVSMRIYSSNGGLGFATLYAEHALALMATSEAAEQARVDDPLRRMLVDGDDETKRRREAYLRGLLAALPGLDRAACEPIFEAIKRPGHQIGYDASLASLRSLVEQSITALETHRQQAIRQAAIDPARLRDVATAAASLGFNKQTGAFPIHAFAHVEIVPDELTTFTLRSLNQEKGAYTAPQLAQPISNEKEWWGTTMRDQVANIIWRDVLQATPFESLSGLSPEEFWSAIKNAALQIRAAGGDPILVISSSMEPSWLNEWRWTEVRLGAQRPDDMTIHRDNSSEPGYEFSLNDIRVYRASCYRGEAYIISQSILERARFHDFGDGLPVSVAFEDDPNDLWRGSLKVDYQHAVKVGNAKAFRIRYAPAKEVREDN
jgi:hypothetical protein